MTLNQAVRLFEEAGIDSPREDAIALFCHFLKKTQIELLLEKCDYDDEALLAAVQRRSKREPLQYIIGSVCFYREDYEVTSDCLIPRSDTEILVDYAVKSIPRGEVFLDLCTGSGCVAISVLCARPDCKAVAVDLSRDALAIAKRNARSHKVEDRLSFIETDALTYIPKKPFDAILSNPPYIKREVVPTLEKEVLFEPTMALDGGKDGLNFYRAFCKNSSLYIYKGGFMALEIGFDQKEAIEALAKEQNLHCSVYKDYGGLDRLAVLKL
ncbi:MAG: peptide chain release factor N(5)-glutamine methyltransferase [Clostridia bacterium]|nr:peptide chain release factor N(5)-glutamine methyltransferase [Clostridia bacterium]